MRLREPLVLCVINGRNEVLLNGVSPDLLRSSVT